MARTRVSSGVILLFILGLVGLAALLSQTESDPGGPGTRDSAGASGMRVACDVSRRLGWPGGAREVQFTAAPAPASRRPSSYFPPKLSFIS